jgi:uncharacterized alkaline shock family protein YloU
MDDDTVGGSGYTLEDLSAYLDRGRAPAIAAIDTNAECQAVLASLERFGALSRELVDRESREPLAEGWFDSVMRDVTREVRAGRDIPLVAPGERIELVITEGAVRELVREAGDAVDGVIVGRTSLDGDLDEAGAVVSVRVTISVRFGMPLTAVADAVRAAVAEALSLHTALRVAAVDVVVDNIHTALEEAGEAEGTGGAGEQRARDE